jgi:hypothetical protein
MAHSARGSTSRKRSAGKVRRRSPSVPKRQLDLPAGYLAGRRSVATLRQVVSPSTPTVEGAALTDEQRTALTLKRIKAQSEFELAGPDGAVIDRARALDEVRRGTAIGRFLVAIELRAIEILQENAETQRRRRAAASRRSRSSRSSTPQR